MDWSAILWFCFVILFLFAESTTVALVSIWFATGSLAALIASLFGCPFWLEAVLFVAVTVLTLCAVRPLLRKYVIPSQVKTNVDALVGQTGKVLTAIDNLQETGRVKIGGMEWTARSTEQAPIEEGKIIKVDRIEGVKVFVSVAE